MPPAAKKFLARTIEIGEPLGHGGMATVHRGRRLSDGQTVAVKVLHEHYALDKEFLTRFRREARAAAALAHPNILAVIESGQDGKIPYIVMEFVNGEDLGRLLQREGPLSAERAAKIAAQVCRALAYAHEQGVIHRDIKPQNILLTDSGEVKVADFGVARAVSASTITQPGTVLGSVPYLSPEQASGQPATKVADLYALGVVLYQMVTGRLPFEGETSVATAIMHIQEMPPPPRSLNPAIPPRLEGIILRALAKRPGERYPSADVMRRDLEGETDYWRESPTITLRPEDRLPAPTDGVAVYGEPAARSARRARRPIPAPVAALLMFGIFGLMLTGWLELGPLSFSAAVPDLRGMTAEAAMAAVSRDHLRMTVGDRQFSDRFAANVVLDQRPAPGERLFRNGEIFVVLSRGPETVLVPDLRGRQLDDAQDLLEQARLKVGKVTAAYSNAREGTIISQTPSRGGRIPAGGTVNLVISKGFAPLPRVDPEEEEEDKGRRRDPD